MRIQEMSERAHARATTSGFYDYQPQRNQTEILARLALIHSEVSEAIEAVRAGQLALTEIDGKPEGMVVELADAMIRIGDLCAWLELDLEGATAAKMLFNAQRPYRHGKAGL